MNKILGFFKEYRFLSNFYQLKNPIVLDSISFPTVEHVYQASKTLDLDKRMEFSLLTAGQAKKLGQTVELRPDWESIKLDIMEALVRSKFRTNKDLADLLIQTGDVYLEETNTWNDTFWGVCNGVGENHLGKILMKVRGELCKSE